ncbi:MAG: serine/threonine protein kinase [Deltaproteobacteria bacterium]|nr:serine/threonine protein kinase [Deltaproteobacteria bacterium]
MSLIADRFEPEARVASGGAGVVYRARDRTTGATVALKLLRAVDPDSRTRFARKAAILATLDHPAIVRYVAHGETATGEPWLAMTWIDGETLADRVQRAPLSLAEVLEIGQQVARALDHGHRRGVVHRDVKPSNLILRDGQLTAVTLVDFGVARAASVASSMTATGTVVGSPGYLSPEQARGARQIGPSSDVFALGCVLYECLTGCAAFEGKHALALIAKAVVWDPPPPRAVVAAVPPALDALVVAMLAKQPAARPADGAAVADRLAAIARALGAPADAATSPGVPRAAGPRAAGLVIASSRRVIDGAGPAMPPDELAARRARLDGRPGLDRVRLELLLDGTVLAIVNGETPPEQIVPRALGCAAEIAAVFPELLVTIKSGALERDGEAGDAAALLEPGFAALVKEAMAAVFAGGSAGPRPAGAIRLDEPTASRMERGEVTRIGGVPYWVRRGA